MAKTNRFAQVLAAWLTAVSLFVGGPLVGDALANPTDSVKAAEYMALATRAEERSDWQVAIRNYELAYQAGKSPVALFNIARNYERLSQLRDAARFLNRFAEETDDGAERQKANAKANELRMRPAEVRFTSEPPGAIISLDGTELGPAPITKTVDAGEHLATATADGSTSPARKLFVEYGEPIAIDFRPGAKPGRLTVNATVASAEVMIDGVAVGKVPYSAELPAGNHTVLVSAPGHVTVARDIEVPSGGSEQITAQLTSDNGSGPQGKPVPIPRSYVLGFGIGIAGNTDAETTARYLWEFGIRGAGGRWDLVGTAGNYGGVLNFGVGVAGRLFLTGGTFRPYLYSGASIASVKLEGTETGRGFGFDAGAGLRYGASTPQGFGYEYFVQANMQIASAPSPSVPEDTTVNNPIIVPTSAIKISFPFIVGISIQFGGAKPANR